MKRSRCKNAYVKHKTVEHWEKYCKLRNECVQITKKAKTKFWKTVKSLFSDKDIKNKKIILVENDDIIRYNKKNAEIMNSYFVNITENLDITEFKTGKYHQDTVVECIDPIDCIIYEYSKHSSILKITKTLAMSNRFLLVK